MRKRTWSFRWPQGLNAMDASERMRRMRARRKGAGLKPIVTWVPRDGYRCLPDPYVRLMQARILALHVMAARKIEIQPELLEIAHRNLARWRERGSGTPGVVIRAWRKALRLPWPEVSALITEQTEAGVRLRSTTPFMDVLTPRERRRIYEAFRLP